MREPARFFAHRGMAEAPVHRHALYLPRAGLRPANRMAALAGPCRD